MEHLKGKQQMTVGSTTTMEPENDFSLSKGQAALLGICLMGAVLNEGAPRYLDTQIEKGLHAVSIELTRREDEGLKQLGKPVVFIGGKPQVEAKRQYVLVGDEVIGVLPDASKMGRKADLDFEYSNLQRALTKKIRAFNEPQAVVIKEDGGKAVWSYQPDFLSRMWIGAKHSWQAFRQTIGGDADRMSFPVTAMNAPKHAIKLGPTLAMIFHPKSAKDPYVN